MKSFFKEDFLFSKKIYYIILGTILAILLPLAYFFYSIHYTNTADPIHYYADAFVAADAADDDSDYAYISLPKKPEILVNIHVGKTGGSTLNTIFLKEYTETNVTVHLKQILKGILKVDLRPIFNSIRMVDWRPIVRCMSPPPQQLYSYQSIRKPREGFYSKLDDTQKEQVKYTGGHIGLEVLNFFPKNKNVKAFALVRDPKGQILSSFWYVMENNDLKKGNHFQDFDVLSADDAILSFIKEANYNNSTLRWFSKNNKNYDNNIPITEEIFKEVKDNIKNDFIFVGITSRFDETIIALRRIMGWNFDEKLFYKKQNETKFKMPESTYSDAVFYQETERFVFEKRLYDWLEKRFDSLIKLLGNDFEEEVRVYKRLNYLYQKDHPEFANQLRAVQKKYKWAAHKSQLDNISFER